MIEDCSFLTGSQIVLFTVARCRRWQHSWKIFKCNREEKKKTTVHTEQLHTFASRCSVMYWKLIGAEAFEEEQTQY